MAVSETIVVDQLALREVQAELRLFAPELLRKLRTELKAEAMSVAKSAGAYLRERSQTDWFKSDYAADHYTVRQRSGLLQLYNVTRGASILEYAGHVSPGGKTERGATLIRTLNQRYGSIASGPKQGRILWASWHEAEPIILENVARLVEQAEAGMNAKLKTL